MNLRNWDTFKLPKDTTISLYPPYGEWVLPDDKLVNIYKTKTYGEWYLIVPGVHGERIRNDNVGVASFMRRPGNYPRQKHPHLHIVGPIKTYTFFNPWLTEDYYVGSRLNIFDHTPTEVDLSGVELTSKNADKIALVGRRKVLIVDTSI